MGMKFKIWIILLTGITGWGELFAQETKVRDTIAGNLQIISVSENDSLKIAVSDVIAAWIPQLGFGVYPTLSPVKYMGYKLCSNAGVELFSWNFPVKDTWAYYSLFRFKDGRVYCTGYIPGDKGKNAPYLFYDLLAFRSKGREYFALLGWAAQKKTNQRAVLMAEFGDNGQINFNVPLMRRGKSRSASLTFEYGKEVNMMLKPDRKGKRIIFDHLSPSDKRYEGYFMFYGPDGDYNALVLKKGEWWFEESVKI